MATIHGAALSPFVRKLRAFMGIKGLSYDHVPVFPGSPDEAFRRISPLGKIPAYTDGDFFVSDSSVICAYLERLHPEPALYPTDPERYARALWHEEYADTRLVEVSGGKIFFPRVVTGKLMKGKFDESAVQEAIDTLLPPVFDYLESQLGDGDHLVGGSVTIADLATASPFVNLKHAGVTVDASRWPKLARYVDAQHASPYFKALVEEEQAMLANV